MNKYLAAFAKVGILLAIIPYAHAGNSQPNIVFILLDDIGFGELQWFPETTNISSKPWNDKEIFFTPNIFNLAKEGLRFTNYHSPASICSPAGAGLLTRQYPQEFAIRD